MKQEYSTKQRSVIMELLKGSSNHVTASDILRYLKEKDIKISTATVYRTLDKLEKEGVLKKMNLGDGLGACYQYMQNSECTQHFHLKCVECGELIHLSCQFLSEMEKHIFKEHAFTISASRTVIYGKCAKCAENSDKKGLE
jgi:Fur family ferric uptake transcriptional regulator